MVIDHDADGDHRDDEGACFSIMNFLSCWQKPVRNLFLRRTPDRGEREGGKVRSCTEQEGVSADRGAAGEEGRNRRRRELSPNGHSHTLVSSVCIIAHGRYCPMSALLHFLGIERKTLILDEIHDWDLSELYCDEYNVYWVHVYPSLFQNEGNVIKLVERELWDLGIGEGTSANFYSQYLQNCN